MAEFPNVQLYPTQDQIPIDSHGHVIHNLGSPDESYRSQSRHGAEAQTDKQPAIPNQNSNLSSKPSHSDYSPLDHCEDQARPSGANWNAKKSISPRRGTDGEMHNRNQDGIDPPIEGSDVSGCGTGSREEEPTSPSPIKYILSYRDRSSRLKDVTVDNMESLEPALDQLKTKEEAILEVNRIIYIEETHMDHTISLAEQKVKIREYGPCKLKIRSASIIQALASIIDYWPGINLNSPSLTVDEPFAVLYQHRKALQDYAKASISMTDQSDSGRCQRITNANTHIKLLLEFLDTRPEAKKIQLEYERHSRSIPVATYEMLWMLFPPGTDIFYDAYDLGFFQGYVVKRATGSGLNFSGGSPFTIKIWTLDFDGQCIGRAESTAQIQPFKGEKEISTLNVIPCDFYERDIAGQVSDKSKAVRQRLENYGETFLKLTKRRCMSYSGELHQRIRVPYNGRVMVDTEGYFYEFLEERRLLTCLDDDEIIPPPECICSYCNSSKETRYSPKVLSRFSEYDEIYPRSADFRGLTPHQKFVCTPRVYGFGLNIRDWLTLRIDKISECQWNTSMIDQQLSIDDGARDIIKGLVQRFDLGLGLKNWSTEQWRADFMADKGDSQIFLLHGPPGVGKTFTAECVAEFLQRPLLSLNCSDIGVDLEKIETVLRKYFQKAKLWNAVVLLDEADVYLEQRGAQDLQRNCIVAAFLRSLEYFNGILFLTTNRVGPFDDALLSRIHIILHYDFDEVKRQAVWDIFYEKLDNERGKHIKVPYSTRQYTQNDPELRKLNWNGRDIRNAFQTAVALAEHKNERDEDGYITLRDKHFKQVVTMSTNFVQYMKRVRGSETEKHAALRGDRNEHYNGKTR